MLCLPFANRLRIESVNGADGQLDDREQVALAVLEPGRAVVNDPGDTGRLVEAREFVLLELHASLLQLAYFSMDVSDAEAHLIVGADRHALAVEEQEPRAAAALVEEAARVLRGRHEA